MKTCTVDRNSPIPLYHQVAEAIRERVRQGAFRPGDQLPVESAFMRMFGVSKPTIRQALAQLVREDLVIRERGRGSFVRPGAQSMSAGAQERRAFGRAGLVMPWSEATLFAPMLEGIEATLSYAGLQTVLVNSQGQAQVELTKTRELLRYGVDGLIWMVSESGPNEAFFASVIGSGLPIVLVDRRFEGIPIDFVSSDNEGGAAQVVTHLIESGRRRIALVREPGRLSSILERTSGYRRALADADLPFDPSLEFISRVRHFENGRRCARRILAVRPQVDAISCQSGDAALGVLAELRQAGVQVPDDIVVTAFDDFPGIAMADPPLTTIRQNVRAMGSAAAELLLERLNDPNRPPRVRRIPVELVIRQSTAPVPRLVSA